MHWLRAACAASAAICGLTAVATAAPAARTNPSPLPVAGGIQLPDGPLIHVFAPGPESVTFPYSKLQLQGRNVEPATLTNFRGGTAVAFLLGTARNQAGKRFNVEVDLRVYRGMYQTSRGVRREGLFGFI